MKGRSAIVGTMLATTMFVWSGVATAQDTVQQVPDATPAAEQEDTTEIFVTAQRRSERLQDVPISLAVVGGETLVERGVSTFEALAPLVPNLSITRTPAANMVILRGIGSADGSPSLDQSVVLFNDGVYGGNARQFSAPFFDVERVEVLRGPQGALVGRNTSAGAINILSRRPGNRLAANLSADYNFTFDGASIEGGLDVPVFEGFSLRFAGRYGNDPGYIYNTLADEDQPRRRDIIGRVVGVLDRGPVSIMFKYEHTDTDGRGNPQQVLAPAQGQFMDYSFDKGITGSEEYDDLVTNNFVANIDIDFGSFVLTSISGYSGFAQRQRLDGDFFASNLALADFDQNFSQVSQEFRLISPSERPFSYVLGGIYSESNLFEQRVTGVIFSPAASTYRQFRQRTHVLSAYASGTYRFSEALRLNASLRYTTESKRARFRLFSGADTIFNRVGTLTRSIDDELSEDSWDPSASLQYYFNRNTMVYASYSRGFKSGGFQGAISNATALGFEFRPEESESYEGGIRLTFPGVGFVNVSGFYTIYNNLQVSSALSTPGSLTSSFFTGNAPEAKIAGLEVEFTLRPLEGLELTGSLGWLPKAEYGPFTNGPCFTGQTPNGSLPGSCDLSGQRLGFAPRFSGSVTLSYTQSISSGLQLRASISPMWRSASQRDFTADPIARQDSFIKLDGRIGIGDAEGRWEVAIVGRNLTDEATIARSATGGLAQTFLSPTARGQVIEPPFNVSLQLSARF